MKIIEQQRNGAAFFSYPVGIASTSTCRKYCGDVYKFFKIIYRDDIIHYIFDDGHIADIGIRLIDKLSKDPGSLDSLLSEWDRSIADFVASLYAVKNTDIENATDQELIDLNEKVWKSFWWFMSVGVVVEPLDFGLPILLRREIEKKIKNKKEVNECLSILTAIPDEAFMGKEEKSIYRLLSNAAESEDIKNAILSGMPAEELSQKFPSFALHIDEHIKRFFYVRCNYLNYEGMKTEEVIGLARELLRKGVDPSELIKELDDKKKSIMNVRKKLIEQIAFDKVGLFLLGVLERYNRMHDERKQYQMMQFYYLGHVLSEVSKRKGIPYELVKYLLPHELKDCLEGKIDVLLLKRRREYSYFDFDERPVKVLYGDAAKKAETAIWSKDSLDMEEINGMCASVGTAIGKVRIVLSPSDAATLNEGDILVAAMTTPDYTPFMKKAAAIVTDDGGITCHAAIIAREMGIPCITGTKIATRLLKDGDIVEVKARHGTVRKLPQ